MRDPVRLSLLCGLLALGCESEPLSSTKDEGPLEQGGRPSSAGSGGSAAIAGGTNTGGAGKGGAAPLTGGRAGTTGGRAGTGGTAPVPPEPAAATGVRIFTGTASMLFDGASCTREAGADGDRWCGFVAWSAARERNLFVVNVSEVNAGTEVNCNEPDEHCILLLANLGGDTFDPTLHGTLFRGDTLVYYDESLAPFVWRPGMSEGLSLDAESDALDRTFCTPASVGAAVACLGLPAEQEDPTLVRGELLVGMADADAPFVTSVDALIAVNSRDTIPRFGYGFPQFEGNYVVWTTRESATGPETLRMVQADDLENVVTVASDVHSWGLSPDGSRWFWLRAIDDATGAGVLQTAAFPDGDDVIDLADDVIQFGLTGTGAGSVVARNGDAELVSIADPVFAPEDQITIDTGVQELLSVTEQGHVAYAKHFVGEQITDLFLSTIEGDDVCVADELVTVPIQSLFFSPAAESAVWASAAAGIFDSFHTHLETCDTSPLATDVVALNWLGDDEILFMDRYDELTGTGALRVRNVDSAHRLDEDDAELIANRVSTYALLTPEQRTVVYTVDDVNDEEDGVYVRALE